MMFTAADDPVKTGSNFCLFAETKMELLTTPINTNTSAQIRMRSAEPEDKNAFPYTTVVAWSESIVKPAATGMIKASKYLKENW